MPSKSARTSYPSAALALIGAVFVVGGGCAVAARPSATTAADTPVGASANASPMASAPLPAWVRAPASDALVAVGPRDPFVSAGHGRDRFTGRLRATDEAAFASPETRVAGFVVCTSHEERGVVVSLFCMRKESNRSADWAYGVAEGYGASWRRSGRLGDCSACHAVGPREGLFEPQNAAPP